MSRFTALGLAAVGATAVVAVLLLTGRVGSSPPPGRGPNQPGRDGSASSGTPLAGTSPSKPAGQSRSGRTAGARLPVSESLVPASGAYLGGYVQPATYTQAAQISAFQSFEHQVGTSLDLVHVYHPWGSAFPSQEDKYFVDTGKVLLLTWGGDPDTKAIIAGQDDAMIRARAEAVKALHHPILLEFRHEMDRPNLQWTIHGPADYIAAWDRVRAIFAAAGATNVSWVWCPTGYGFQDGRAEAFYPGDNEVDWICSDVYSDSGARSLSAAAGAFLRWASHHDKPVIIGEFATDGNPSGWASWLLAAGELARSDPQIKAIAYFDANGNDSQGRPFHYWLGDQPAALSAFGRLASDPFFHPVAPNDP
jgi:Glycosyl hydrolase family 26